MTAAMANGAAMVEPLPRNPFDTSQNPRMMVRPTGPEPCGYRSVWKTSASISNISPAPATVQSADSKSMTHLRGGTAL